MYFKNPGHHIVNPLCEGTAYLELLSLKEKQIILTKKNMSRKPTQLFWNVKYVPECKNEVFFVSCPVQVC